MLNYLATGGDEMKNIWQKNNNFSKSYLENALRKIINFTRENNFDSNNFSVFN